MKLVNRLIRPLRSARRALHFRLWVAHVRLDLRRRGGRLILDAPHGVRWDSAPHFDALPMGDGDGTFTLRIGRGVTLGRSMILEVHARGTNLLEIGDGVYFQHGVRVQLRGGAIRLGDRANVRDWAMLRSAGQLTAGADVAIAQATMIHCSQSIELRDRVGIAERVSILDTDHQADGSDEYFYTRPIKVAPVVVDANTFIAAGAVILCGTHIGRNSVVAANAVVGEGSYPPGHVLAGLPARPVKRLPNAPAE